MRIPQFTAESTLPGRGRTPFAGRGGKRSSAPKLEPQIYIDGSDWWDNLGIDDGTDGGFPDGGGGIPDGTCYCPQCWTTRWGVVCGWVPCPCDQA
jgi:hypothetical protein